MKKVIVDLLLFLVTKPMLLVAQVNPQKGYVITNENDTVYGTIDYLTDARNAKACLFQKNGEREYKSLSPADIRGYRLADDGVYYVSRMFNGGDKPELLFAEFPNKPWRHCQRQHRFPHQRETVETVCVLG